MHPRSGNLCTKFHTLSLINNWELSGVLPTCFSSFLVDLSYLANVMLHLNYNRPPGIDLIHSNLGSSVRAIHLKTFMSCFMWKPLLDSYLIRDGPLFFIGGYLFRKKNCSQAVVGWKKLSASRLWIKKIVCKAKENFLEHIDISKFWHKLD